MNKRKRFLISLTFIYFFSAHIATGQPGPEGRILSNGIVASPRGFLDEIPMAPPIERGSFYYKNDYVKGKLCLKGVDYCIDNIDFRVDLKNNYLEFVHDDGTIRQFDIIDLQSYAYKVNEGSYEKFVVDASVLGHFKLLYEDEAFRIMEQHYIETIEPKVNQAISSVDREIKHVIKKKMFISDKNGLIEFKRSLKSIRKAINVDLNLLKNYKRVNNLDISLDDDLINLISTNYPK